MRVVVWLRQRRERKNAELIELAEKQKQARDAAPNRDYFLSEESPHQRGRDQETLIYFPVDDGRE
jgi:hypothetical protein